MKSETDDGGAAFPIIDVASEYNRDTHSHDSVATTIHSHGMSLLDYFAAKAMEGDWAAQYGGNDGTGTFSPNSSDECLLVQAKLYYRMGRAMLLARKATP